MIARDRAFETIRASAADIARVARTSPSAGVPRYPGTDVEGLVRHVITIHEWVARLVDEGHEEPLAQDPPPADLSGDALLERFETAADRVVAVLAAADPTTPVWTFGVDRTVAFWVPRMAHETTIHAWDADSAVTSDPAPIPVDVAESGLAEGLLVHCARPLRRTEVGGSGETLGLRCTDTDGAWTVTLNDVGIDLEDGVADPDATLDGTASDLWLAIGGRLPFDVLEAAGDHSVVDRFRTAVGSIRAAM